MNLLTPNSYSKKLHLISQTKKKKKTNSRSGEREEKLKKKSGKRGGERSSFGFGGERKNSSMWVVMVFSLSPSFFVLVLLLFLFLSLSLSPDRVSFLFIIIV
jgi:hypothetical protein